MLQLQHFFLMSSLCLLLFCVLQKQLFGIEAPAHAQLTGWRKHLNSYTLQGRRNVCSTLKGNLCAALSPPDSLICNCLLSCSVC